MTDKEDVFLKQMKGVDPIKKKNRIEKKNKTELFFKKIKTNKKIEILKKNKEHPEDIINTKFSLENVNIKKSIKKGFFKIDQKVDFHGNSLLESEELFSTTIVQCYQGGQRCVLFVTGKGLYKHDEKDENKPKLFYGLIRKSFLGWVKSNKFSKFILSYEGASVEHGGDGAFYVYLRKKKTKFSQV